MYMTFIDDSSVVVVLLGGCLEPLYEHSYYTYRRRHRRIDVSSEPIIPVYAHCLLGSYAYVACEVVE